MRGVAAPYPTLSHSSSRWFITPFTSRGGGCSTTRAPSKRTCRTWSVPIRLAGCAASTLVDSTVPSNAQTPV